MSAGHLPLPVLYSEGQAQYLGGRGLPVGLFAEATYTDHQLKLPQRFSLSLFSDGILEVLPGDSLKQREAVLPQLIEQANGNLSELRQILGLAKKGDMPDDIAMLVLSRNLA